MNRKQQSILRWVGFLPRWRSIFRSNKHINNKINNVNPPLSWVEVDTSAIRIEYTYFNKDMQRTNNGCCKS